MFAPARRRRIQRLRRSGSGSGVDPKDLGGRPRRYFRWRRCGRGPRLLAGNGTTTRSSGGYSAQLTSMPISATLCGSYRQLSSSTSACPLRWAPRHKPSARPRRRVEYLHRDRQYGSISRGENAKPIFAVVSEARPRWRWNAGTVRLPINAKSICFIGCQTALMPSINGG